jgi:hypothetical protein
MHLERFGAVLCVPRPFSEFLRLLDEGDVQCCQTRQVEVPGQA